MQDNTTTSFQELNQVDKRSETQVAIKKALSRLVKEGRIRRLAHGIYYIPKKDPVLGEIRPDTDEVVKMLAHKEHIRVRPAGAYALHQLGLTTQVPTKRVYLTDGNPGFVLDGTIVCPVLVLTPFKN